MFKAKCPKKDNSSALTRQACIWFAKSEEIFLNIDTDLDHGSCTMVQNHGLCNEKLLRTCNKLLGKSKNLCTVKKQLKTSCQSKHICHKDRSKTSRRKLFSHKEVNACSTDKCNKQRLKTYERLTLIMCGDVELNPGPDNNGTAMSVFNARLARIGLAVINIVGNGNCFFHSVSHQLYKTETYHTQIRAVGIQHLINCHKQFIESNTEQSWMQYLQNMSRLGTWADNIIIQAVANAHNLTIHIIESAQNFAESTVVSPVYTEQERNSRHIYIGHVDEMHYVSTSPIIRIEIKLFLHSLPINKTTPTQIMDTSLKPSKTSSNSKNRNEYMRKYIKNKRRQNNEFRKKENERKIIHNKKYKNSNAEKIRDSWKKASAIYRKSKSDKTRSQQNEGAQSNTRKRKSSKISETKYKQNDVEHSKINKKRQYSKRKVNSQNEEVIKKQKKLTITEIIERFHETIGVGPEYICTCCSQIWYESAVIKCNPDLYRSCPSNILSLCLTGLKSISNTEWICYACHSNLKAGKMPCCATANKMTFPEKPDALKSLTPLEERLVSPRIPFMQVRELPSGGQLSIHGSVVNVPADVNSTVTVLPRLVNESQTITIKLKHCLGYKHHYQFQNVRPSKVLEAARYLIQTRDIFKQEGIQVSDQFPADPENHAEEWSEFIDKPKNLNADH